MFKIIITIVSLLTKINSQNICIPDNDLVNNVLSSNHGSKLNLTMTDLSLNVISCETLKISNKTGWIGGCLILSDSPEYPSTRGILYEDGNLQSTQEDIPNRIFMYHVNGKTDGILNFAIFVTNLHQNESATLTLVRKGVAEPTKNYILSGQAAFYSWLKSERNVCQKIIEPLQSVQLDSAYYQFNVRPDELLHGIYDYGITQNHKITLCALESDDNPDMCLNLPILPRDGHIRGTFPSSDKHLDINHKLSISKVQQFPIADGFYDEYISGLDATDSTMQINSGNYGVLYQMHFNISSSSRNTHNQSEVGYLVNARGGIWAGAVGIIDEEGTEDAHLLPEAESGILRNNFDGALIGNFDTGINMVFLWMPTGGSNLPVRIVGVEHITDIENVSSAALNLLSIEITCTIIFLHLYKKFYIYLL